MAGNNAQFNRYSTGMAPLYNMNGSAQNMIRTELGRLGGTSLVPNANQMDDNNALADSTPITYNRFDNNTPDHDTNYTDPYYVSGSPIANNPSVSTINMDNSTPYNGMQNPNSDYTNNNMATDSWGQQHTYHPRRTSTFMTQTNCLGSNNQSTRVPNVITCQNMCINDNDCKMWSFNNRNQQCFLKNQVGQCKPNESFTSGRIVEKSKFCPQPQPQPYPQPQPQPYPQPYPQPQPVKRQSTIMQNVAFGGRPSRNMMVGQQNECKNACLMDNKCNKWTYNNNNRLCAIRHGHPGVVIARPNSVSGEIFLQQPEMVPQNAPTNTIYPPSGYPGSNPSTYAPMGYPPGSDPMNYQLNAGPDMQMYQN